MSLKRYEIEILNYIREGRNSLADFTDNLGIPAPIANKIAEKLEQETYIVRASYIGIERFNWLLTDKGVSQLDPLSEYEMRLLKEGCINITQYKILTYVGENPKSLVNDICEKMKINRNDIIPNLCYLVDHKLLYEVGIIRWKVSITERGEKIASLFDNIFK